MVSKSLDGVAVENGQFASLRDRYIAAVAETRELSRLNSCDEYAIGQKLSAVFDLANRILDHDGEDIGWLALKSQVALEYANPDGDIVHKAASRLAEAVLCFVAELSDAENDPEQGTSAVDIKSIILNYTNIRSPRLSRG